MLTYFQFNDEFFLAFTEMKELNKENKAKFLKSIQTPKEKETIIIRLNFRRFVFYSAQKNDKRWFRISNI